MRFLLSLAIPGYAFFANDRRALGWCFLGGYCGSAVLFVVALGYQIGNLSFGLMISAHAASIIFLESLWLRDAIRFRFRIVVAALTLLVLWLGLYGPAVNFLQRNCITPVRIRNQVVILQHLDSPRSLSRGDWIMYSIHRDHSGDAHNGGAVWIRAGYGWGAILAVAGDAVVFTNKTFSVNGKPQRSLPHMPVSGEVLVPEKHWFIWPDLDVANNNVSEATMSAMMLELAMVPETQFAGKPFKHWFGRRQHLP